MKKGLIFLGPLTFVVGLALVSLSFARPAIAQNRNLATGIWLDLNTTPTYPPGIDATAREVDANLNNAGGADFVVYVPELHRIFAHYRR